MDDGYITEDVCAATGGHCFQSTGDVIAGDPVQYPEACKHCGKKRIGIPQPDMRYTDA